MASSQNPSSSSDGFRPPSKPARNAGRSKQGPSKLDSLFSQLQTPVKGLKPPGRGSGGSAASQKQAQYSPSPKALRNGQAKPDNKVRSVSGLLTEKAGMNFLEVAASSIVIF